MTAPSEINRCAM